MGDVLTGAIAGILAQCRDPWLAARAGVMPTRWRAMIWRASASAVSWHWTWPEAINRWSIWPMSPALVSREWLLPDVAATQQLGASLAHPSSGAIGCPHRVSVR